MRNLAIKNGHDNEVAEGVGPCLVGPTKDNESRVSQLLRPNGENFHCSSKYYQSNHIFFF